MTIRSRVDIDAVYHDSSDSVFSIGSLSEHISPSLTYAISATATAGTTAVSISGPGSLSTLVVKNTGNTVIRLAGAIDVTPGRLAVLPTTATVTVSAPSGSGTYSCLWMG